jgi:hypothetical protein
MRTVRSFSFDSGSGGSSSSFGDLGSGDFSEHMDLSGEEMLQEPRTVGDGQSSPDTIVEGDVIGVGFDQETLEVSLIIKLYRRSTTLLIMEFMKLKDILYEEWALHGSGIPRTQDCPVSYCFCSIVGFRQRSDSSLL